MIIREFLSFIRAIREHALLTGSRPVKALKENVLRYSGIDAKVYLLINGFVTLQVGFRGTLCFFAGRQIHFDSKETSYVIWKQENKNFL